MQNPQKHATATASAHGGNSNDELIGFVALSTSDPAQFEQALRPWQLLSRPKSAGLFSHGIAMLRGPNFLLYREKFSISMSVVGLSPPGMLGIAIPIGKGIDAKYWGETHGVASLPMTSPGGLDVVLDSGHDHLVAFIDIKALERCLTECDFVRLERLALMRRVNVPRSLRLQFEAWLKRTLLAFGSKLELAKSFGCLDQVFQDLVRHLTIIAQALEDENVKPTRRSMRDRGFHRALEYLREQMSANLTMSELCTVSGTSERTLQYAFRETFNMTPQEFMIRRRLHRVRQVLLDSEPNACAVSQVAMDHGFYELGRFSGKYRIYFGELPSTTLLRSKLSF